MGKLKRYTKKRTRFFRTQVFDNYNNRWVYLSSIEDDIKKGTVEKLPNEIDSFFDSKTSWFGGSSDSGGSWGSYD